MVKAVTPNMLDPKTPPDVVIRAESRPPTTDPTLGIPVQVDRRRTPRHRLVTLGDSLTHGFQSGAIFNTSLSYPRLVASALGWSRSFRYPSYASPGAGLPLNLEALSRKLESQFGKSIDWWETVPALATVRDFLDSIEDYWERGEGAKLPTQAAINHNLAVYGWDLRNTLSRTATDCQAVIDRNPSKDDFLQQIVESANERAALRVLPRANAQNKSLSPVKAAAALGAEGSIESGDGDGIETLIILIGSNNALGSILTFEVNWSDDRYDDMAFNDRYTVWRPIHFQAELDRLVAEVKKIRARHVIWGTVPHVTIVPFARGVGQKESPGSRYFPYYTPVWIADKDFDPNKHPNITGPEARAIDSAIDQYNDSITDAVRAARLEGHDWYVFELGGLLDRLATRRYKEDPDARPDWWTPYELPAALQALDPTPDTRFFISNAEGRTSGGLFSLDGIHPTTIGYGIVAQELINIMQLAGVKFYKNDEKTLRPYPVQIDFEALIPLDTLIAKPPRLVANVLNLIGWFDQNLNIMSGLLKANF